MPSPNTINRNGVPGRFHIAMPAVATLIIATQPLDIRAIKAGSQTELDTMANDTKQLIINALSCLLNHTKQGSIITHSKKYFNIFLNKLGSA